MLESNCLLILTLCDKWVIFFPPLNLDIQAKIWLFKFCVYQASSDGRFSGGRVWGCRLLSFRQAGSAGSSCGLASHGMNVGPGWEEEKILCPGSIWAPSTSSLEEVDSSSLSSAESLDFIIPVLTHPWWGSGDALLLQQRRGDPDSVRVSRTAWHGSGGYLCQRGRLSSQVSLFQYRAVEGRSECLTVAHQGCKSRFSTQTSLERMRLGLTSTG